MGCFVMSDIEVIFEMACQERDQDLIVKLISDNDFFGYRFPGGDSLVSYAARNSLYKVLDCLVDLGCSPDLPDDRGYTGLYDAIERVDIQMINYLISRGASLDFDTPDETPRQLMIRKNLILK